MNSSFRRISGAVISLTLLLTGSFAQGETGALSGKVSSPAGQRMKWNSVEEIIKELALPVGPTARVADARDGDPKLLRELLDQSNGELRGTAVSRTNSTSRQAGLIASR
jgi:hypothetical protein